MAYVFASWSPDFAASLGGIILSVLGAGVFLVAMFWIVGYVIDRLFHLMK